MDFTEFYEAYKNEFKKIRLYILPTKLPLYRRIFLAFIFAWGIMNFVFYCIKSNCPIIVDGWISGAIDLFLIVSLFLGMGWFWQKEHEDDNWQYMNSIFKENRDKRNKILLSTLAKMNIDYKDRKAIECLINIFRKAQKDSFVLDIGHKSYHILAGLIVLTYRPYYDEVVKAGAVNDFIIYAIIVFSVAGLLAHILWRIVSDAVVVLINMFIIKTDYYIYEVLIHDLEQLMIFQKNAEVWEKYC